MRAAAAACKIGEEQEEKCYEKLNKNGCNGNVFWVQAIEPYQRPEFAAVLVRHKQTNNKQTTAIQIDLGHHGTEHSATAGRLGLQAHKTKKKRFKNEPDFCRPIRP
jgi:hypothetical protein